MIFALIYQTKYQEKISDMLIYQVIYFPDIFHAKYHAKYQTKISKNYVHITSIYIHYAFIMHYHYHYHNHYFFKIRTITIIDTTKNMKNIFFLGTLLQGPNYFFLFETLLQGKHKRTTHIFWAPHEKM